MKIQLSRKLTYYPPDDLKKVIVGIDPGVNTGFAIWHPDERIFYVIETLQIHQAFFAILAIKSEVPEAVVQVIFEDARQRTWFGKTGSEVWKGAGSIIRDCKAWEDFLTDEQIPFIARKPASGGTKWDKDFFKRVTGWTGKTNEHSRDAACLVFNTK